MYSDHFSTKNLQVSRGDYTYHYVYSPPKDAQRPTLAFFHGFPSTAHDWRHQLEYFSALGYGVFATDMLGYGGTSKPENVSAYEFRLMVEDMIEILDHERIDRVHGISHDFGSHFMSRLFNYYPRRLLSMTFISVPYSPPAVLFDLKGLNAKMRELIGVEKFGYMKFLASDSSPAIIEAHLKSFHALVYARDTNLKADNFYLPGALEAWLASDQDDQQTIVNEEETARWLDAFRSGGLRGPTNWYRALVGNINYSQEDKDLSRGQLTTALYVPVLAVDSQPDKFSISNFMEMSVRPHTKRMKMNVVEADGHWPHIVAHEVVNRVIKAHVDSASI